MSEEYKIVNNVLRIEPKGDLTGLLHKQELLEAAENALESSISNCLVDLSGLKYINSADIGTLVTLLTKFRNAGGEVVLLNPSEHIRKLLVITKLHAIFDVFNDEEEALKELKG